MFELHQKVRTRYLATPETSATLEKLVENEKDEKKRTATEGLMWLLRGLSFTCQALQNAQGNKSEELAAAFTKSYEGTLKKFHNFVVKGIFSVGAVEARRSGLSLIPFLKGRYEGMPISC